MWYIYKIPNMTHAVKRFLQIVEIIFQLLLSASLAQAALWAFALLASDLPHSLRSALAKVFLLVCWVSFAL